MRTPEDALRSIRRFLGLVLPEPWDIQWVRTEDLERPGAVIRSISPETDSGSAYVRDLQVDYEIFIYPPGLEGNPQFGLIEAERIKERVRSAITKGGHGAKSLRIPVFDYDGVPYDQGLPENAEHYDYLVVSNVRGQARVDPDDDSLFNVIIDLRAAWRADGDTSRFEGAILQGVGLSYSENIAPDPSSP